MKQATLDRIAPLLDVLRAHPALSEVRPTEFELDGREFLHFHEDEGGAVADVRLAGGRVSMRVASSAEQADFLERIDPELSSLEARALDRQRRGRERRSR